MDLRWLWDRWRQGFLALEGLHTMPVGDILQRLDFTSLSFCASVETAFLGLRNRGELVVCVATSRELTKEERIRKELNRLRRNLKPVIPKNQYQAADGLLQRAAFLRIELEDLEEHIKTYGSIQPGPRGFQASAAAQLYEKLTKVYNGVCKELNNLVPNAAATLPKEPAKGGQAEDPFIRIMNRKGREAAVGGMRRVK